MASNGIGDLGKYDFINRGMYPGSQIDHSYYASPTQTPLGAQAAVADYDPAVNPMTGEAVSRFNEGGIASFKYGGTPEEQRALIADVYQKILGRAPGEGEDITQWASQLGETGDTIELANRLAQTEEGTAYGKSNPNEVYKGAAQLSQVSSPFKDTETPYSNMKYVASHTTPTTEDGQGGVTTHRFQDQNGGVITVGADGQPINYEPGRGWYEEQLRKNPDAVRKSDYRNQTYLSKGPIDQTYKFNGVDVPISAAEYQIDPQTGKFITGKTGDFAPVLMRDPGYDWFNDWGGPAMVAAVPLAAYAGTTMLGAAAAEGAAVPLAEITGSSFAGPAFALPEAAAATTIGAPIAEPVLGITTIAPEAAAYPGMSAELAAELGLAGSSSGLSGAGASGDVLANLGIEAAEKGITAKQALGTKMLIDTALNSLGSGQGQGGQGPSATTSPLIFNPNANKMSTPGISPIGSNQPYGQLYDTKANTYKYYAQGGITNLDPTYAHGGITSLGSYSDGGHLLKGPGDGMSDHIPATIGGKQPARLADGEFVIPADVVSHLGNGSTDAGAKQLYKMMDKIRKARTGRKQQGKKINPNKYTLKG